MASRVVCTVLALQLASGSENYNTKTNEGFISHLHTGMKLAQNLLGSESVALKVAEFVVRAFHTGNTPQGASVGPAQGSHVDDSQGSEERSHEERPPNYEYGLHELPLEPDTPWRHLVRLLGLQPGQLSAVAVNALVLVAQMITSFLAGPRRSSKPGRRGSEDSIDWILHRNSKTLQGIIATAKNDSLKDLLEELVSEYGKQEEASCIRLLVCKITPFVTGMQKAVFGKAAMYRYGKHDRGAAVLYRHLPSVATITETSEACEQRFHDCHLNE